MAEFVAALLNAEEAALRAALAEPDDDTYLAAHAAAAAFYAPPPGSPPLGPRSGRAAVPGGTSPDATRGPGDDLGAQVYGVARVAEPRGWVAFAGDGHDPDGVTLGLAVLVEEVDGALRAAGRADWDPFADGIRWAAAGGLVVPVDGPFNDVLLIRRPKLPAHAAWLEGRLAPDVRR